MRCRKGCLLMLVFVFLCLANVKVSAQEIPLIIQAERTENSNEILISVIATEPVVLEAFTFSITFDKETYKLHKGNDEQLNGYGYVKEFEQHQDSAMMLSNALEDRIIFSGVNQSEVADGYEGAIAQAALLQYDTAGESLGDISLVITALQIKGWNLKLTGVEKKIPCQITDTVSTENVYVSEEIDDIVATYPGVSQTMVSQVPVNTGEVIGSQNTSLPQNLTGEIVLQEPEASMGAVTDFSIVIDKEGNSESAFVKEETGSKKFFYKEKCFVLFAVAVGIIGMSVGIVVFFDKKRKKRSE